MVFRANLSIDRKKEDISKYLPRAFDFFGTEADLEVIQFSYFLGVIKAFIAQNLNNNK